MDLSSQQEIHLSHYWNVIRKRWKVAASILIVVVAGTFLSSYFQKPEYRAQILLQIERENPNQLTVEDLFGIEASEQEFLQTQYVLLKSRGLAARVIDEQNLLSDPDFYPQGIAGRTPAEVRDIRDAMARSLAAGISVEPVRATSLVTVAYVGPTPRLTRKVAEGWGKAFINQNISKKLDSVNQASKFLIEQIGATKKELDEARGALQRYGRERDIVAVGPEGNPVLDKLTQLNAQLTFAQNERFQKQAAFETLLRTSPESATAGDPLVLSLTAELSSLQRQQQEKTSQLMPGHPTMVQLGQQIDKARTERERAIRSSYAKLRETAQGEANSAAAREASVRAAFEGQKGETQKLNVDAATYLDLQRTVDTKQQMLATMQKQLSETEVQARLRGSATSNITVVDHAELPGGRHNVTLKKNLQNAVPLGLILGIAAIFFLEYMDRSVKTPEELETVTRFASLGVIPSAASMGRSYGYSYGERRAKLRAVDADGAAVGVELIPHTDSRSPVSEAYRAFRTSLLLASANSPKVIVITSSFAREGKTTTSINLATVLAQMGKPVLLIDADLRRPRIQKVFRGKMNVGLVNHLAAGLSVDEVIQGTEVPNLSVMLSGPIPPNPSELLASDKMKHMIEEVRSKYAFVIFDSPPVLAVTDAIVLAASADGVVLTIHGGVTPRELVQRSAERLRHSNIPVLGALLNNLDLQQYGYTYRKSYYDYYESDDRHEAERPARKTS
jgi:polysaccharide biosynthesis transport protein